MCDNLRIILCVHPANERCRYTVTASLIGWVHTQNDPCILYFQEKNHNPMKLTVLRNSCTYLCRPYDAARQQCITWQKCNCFIEMTFSGMCLLWNHLELYVYLMCFIYSCPFLWPVFSCCRCSGTMATQEACLLLSICILSAKVRVTFTHGEWLVVENALIWEGPWDFARSWWPFWVS